MKKTKKKPAPINAEKRRQKIIGSALKLYSTQGVSGTQSKQVAVLAGVDQSLIGYYFPTADTLFAEVIQQLIQEFNGFVLNRVAESGSDVEKALQTYTEAFFQWIGQNRESASLLIYFFYMAALRDPFVSINETSRRVARERLSGYVYRGIAEGVFKPIGKGGGEALTDQIQAAILGGALICMTERGRDPMEFAQHTWRAIRKNLL